MEFSVAAFEGVAYGLDGVNDIETCNEVLVHLRGVADKTENGLIAAYGDVDINALTFQPSDKLLLFFFLSSVLQNYYHFLYPP